MYNGLTIHKQSCKFFKVRTANLSTSNRVEYNPDLEARLRAASASASRGGARSSCARAAWVYLKHLWHRMLRLVHSHLPTAVAHEKESNSGFSSSTLQFVAFDAPRNA